MQKKELHDWFVNEYPKHCSRKLDMGKSCIRFKKLDEIPFDLISELTRKMTCDEWISIYESALKKNKIMKKRVTGIGGLFFKSKDPKALKNGYKKHLDLNTNECGCLFGEKKRKVKMSRRSEVLFKMIQLTLSPLNKTIYLISE